MLKSKNAAGRAAARRWRATVLAALIGCLAGLSAPPVASGATALKRISYLGTVLTVPSEWPVYRLDRDRTRCVRFDRHAVYLGRPSAQQRCPAHAAGRTEALLVEPAPARLAGATRRLPPTGAGPAGALVGVRRGAIVTATWRSSPSIIERALGFRSATALQRAAAARPPERAPARTHGNLARAAAASAAAGPGDLYTGPGFDACATPSAAQMSAWRSSPYRALGVYIGGTNMACAQPNLTSTWVSQQSAAGWHLIPIYVGLQAPGNSCGCASISPRSAAGEGAAAAGDAVAQAQAVGLGPGNPLYFDMEGYARGGAASSAVLAFLQAWTTQLHSSGYKAGVYSSANSGIRDLVSQVGTGFIEPDDIWIANWNGAQTTSDANVPPEDWSAHQRLHQYEGDHNETYGGVTINIDGDYLDGATAGAQTVTQDLASAPTLTVRPAADGAIDLSPSWPDVSGISSWQVLSGSSPAALAPFGAPAGTDLPIVVHGAWPYFAIRALGSGGETLGISQPVATPAHVAIFGHSAFVSRAGTAGLPVGCFAAGECHVATTISYGRTVLARTGPERVSAGGLTYFTVSPSARMLLARARRHRLAVAVTLRDASGMNATRTLNLVRFATFGRRPQRTVAAPSALRIIGTTDFVSAGWTGGILAGCFASSPCRATVTVSASGRAIARARAQTLGPSQLGYLFFTLTPAGHALLRGSRGNQLPVDVVIAIANSASARARLVLVSFS